MDRSSFKALAGFIVIGLLLVWLADRMKVIDVEAYMPKLDVAGGFAKDMWQKTRQGF